MNINSKINKLWCVYSMVTNKPEAHSDSVHCTEEAAWDRQASRWGTQERQEGLRSLPPSQSFRDFPGGPVFKNLPCNAGEVILSFCQGTKIPHAVGQLSPCVLELMFHNWREVYGPQQRPRAAKKKKKDQAEGVTSLVFVPICNSCYVLGNATAISPPEVFPMTTH